MNIIPEEINTKTNYKKVNPETLKETIKALNLKQPADCAELIQQLEDIRKTLPTKRIRDQPRLSKDILERRRTLNKAIRKKEDSERIRNLRLEYRKAIREHNNTRIEKALEDSNDNHQFFELSKRGTRKKMIPPQTMDGKTYRTHEEICDAIAKHHGEAEEQPEDEGQPTDNHHGEIPTVRFDEVSDAINKAPTDSTIGTDDIGIPLLRTYHRSYPNYLGNIFTDILRRGKHPTEWKEAMVVPIPKANKETYSHPKAWRSLHLLSLVSKTLERIVLNRLQEYGEHKNTLNETQFGSRRHTGTSDAFQLYKEWKEQARRENLTTSYILADVEGGFDKVNPEAFKNGTTRIDPKYNKWVYNWTQNRRIKFRFNGRNGRRTYITNRGLPQGSPLSPYLFGAYIREIVSEDFLQNVLIISYVDDLLICIKGTDQEEVEALTRAAWTMVNEWAEQHGMSFAENKTKTFHDDPNTMWRIGKLVKELRFLGYWTSQTDEDNDHAAKHVKHWLTKSNYSYNVIRALVQRTDSHRGMRMTPTLRLIHSITRTIAWYGLEHYGEHKERNQEVDSFLYASIRRLLDMPLNTPHRSISADYGLTPTEIQYRYVKDRIRHRHKTFPHIMTEARRKANLPQRNTADPSQTTAPWTVPVPEPRGPVTSELSPKVDKTKYTIPDLCWKINSTGTLIYTDGSANPKNPNIPPSYGIIMLNYQGNQITTEEGVLFGGKSILDAETTAIYKAMEMAMVNRPPSADPSQVSKTIIMSDSKIAIDAVLRPKRSGTLAYLNIMRADIEDHPDRHLHHFTIGHVKGHSKDPGNDAADKLAKKAKTYRDHLPLTTHSKEATRASNQRQQDWEDWFNQKEHQSRSKPTRRLKRHNGLTRQDSSVLFRLKTNKGWNQEDNIGTQPPPPCTLCEKDQPPPQDAIHLFECDGTKDERPADASTAIQRQIPPPEIVRWIRHHNHFGFKNKVYDVNYIKLKIGQYRRNTDLTCPYCPNKILSSKQNLRVHIKGAHENNPQRLKPTDTNTCDLCGKLVMRCRMEKHKATHDTEDCEVCGKTLQRKTMERHMRVHRERRCEECSKTFSTNTKLKNHMKSHEGKICHGCSTTFKTKVKLKEHQRSNCGGSRS